MSAIVWRIDYVGIAGLIVASFYPVVYYSFMCVPRIRAAYLGVMSAFGAAVLVITLMDRFQAPQYSPLRAALFSCLGGCGSFPILHQTWFTWHTVPTPIAVMLWMELLMGACYLFRRRHLRNLCPGEVETGAIRHLRLLAQHISRIGGDGGVRAITAPRWC